MCTEITRRSGAWWFGPAQRLIVLLVLVGVCDVWGADWPHWRGPGRDGISAEDDWRTDWPEDGPELLWEAEIGVGFASMAVADGAVYAMGNIDDEDHVWCFDAVTGEELWVRRYDADLQPRNYEGGPSATPTVYDGDVYTLSKFGDLFCFNADDGEEIWYTDLEDEVDLSPPRWGLASSPVIMGNTMVLNVGSNGMGINRGDGRVLWDSGGEDAGYASAVPFTMGGRKLAAIFTGKALVAVDPQGGGTLWQYQWKTSYDVNAADPIFHEDKVFVTSGYNVGAALLAYDRKGAEEIWRNKNMRAQFTSAILHEGFLYGFDESTLVCLDFKTGEPVWTQRGLGKGSLIGAADKLIILSERGVLVIAEASPDEFKELARNKVLGGRCWTPPVLANGLIYARNAVGDLVCVDVRGDGDEDGDDHEDDDDDDGDHDEDGD